MVTIKRLSKTFVCVTVQQKYKIIFFSNSYCSEIDKCVKQQLGVDILNRQSHRRNGMKMKFRITMSLKTTIQDVTPFVLKNKWIFILLDNYFSIFGSIFSTSCFVSLLCHYVDWWPFVLCKKPVSGWLEENIRTDGYILNRFSYYYIINKNNYRLTCEHIILFSNGWVWIYHIFI